MSGRDPRGGYVSPPEPTGQDDLPLVGPITSACPSCGVTAERTVYDIGSGPELSCANCEWCWGADGQPLQPLRPSSITCPACGMTSYNPNDVVEGYCGNCHMWTPQLGWDEQIQSYVVTVTANWIVSVTPMIFNDRICLTHRQEYPWFITSGWCYDKGPAAHLAAAVFDPETQHEPAGYKKVAADGRVKLRDQDGNGR